VTDNGFSSEINSDADSAARRTNGKLSHELLETAGISVTEKPPAVTTATPDEFGKNIRGKVFFEEAIAAAWRETAVGILRVGRLLREAKDELDPKDFKALELPFGLRTRQRLMAIAGNIILATHASRLPPSWMTLYVLSRIPDQRLLELLKTGAIHPGLERKDVAALLGRDPKKGVGKKAKKETKEAEENRTTASPTLAEVWSISSREEKRKILDQEQRAGLARIASPSLLAELVDHVLGQQINTAPCPNMDSKASDVRVSLTKIFRHAVNATTPEGFSATQAFFKRKCENNNLDYRDLLITFPKKRAPKKR
jgi:hypothetical protein